MPKPTAACLLTVALALLTACGSSSSAPAGATTAGGGVNPNAPETLPPGDIPDTVAYVPYAVPGAGYTLSTPEGWSRSSAGGVLAFTDKLNKVEVSTAPAAGPVSPAWIRRTVLPRLSATVRGFRLQSVAAVTRKAGPAIRTAYLGYSKADPVTGKFGVLAVERYDFLHRGRDVVITLSAPDGSDNVDPWNKVTNSLVFTR